MKSVRIKFCDFSKNFNVNDNDFINILKKRYSVELSDNPDYVFYSVFGDDHLRYNCIRIFYTGECYSPDFNIADYAIGFDYIKFGDRYLRVPLYRLFQYKDDLEKALSNRIGLDKNRRFCSFVCSNDRGMAERVEMFELLQSYMEVGSGGKYKNNVGAPVPDKIDFLRNYKFNIAFENCVGDGYTTEKIVQAFAAGAIPIYYGNPLIAREFNTKAFVNCHDYKDFNEVLDIVKRINEDDNLYYSMIREPITNQDYLDLRDLEEFLYNIFEQRLESARRRPKNALILEHERECRILSKEKTIILKPIRRFKNLVSRLRNRSI